jgi:hypothetical protein
MTHRGPVAASVRDVIAHHRRHARALGINRLTPHINHFHARPRDLRERRAANGSPMPGTTPEDAAMAESYTGRAGQAVLEAAGSEHDFGDWLAHVLAAAAAELGSTDALTAGRPGSWEADLVQRHVKGTVGWDAYLADHKTLPDRG